MVHRRALTVCLLALLTMTVVMSTGDIVMTYVVRKGYINTPDGFPQFGIEAVVSRDHGQTWDLDHRYRLHTWVGNRKGYFKGEQRYSLVMVESTDGLGWKFRSLIAGFDCQLVGGEGPCESQTVRLKDGQLMNVFRLASDVPYGQTFSADDGRTWSAPVAMRDAHSVQPSVAQMKDGSLVLTGGRPGIFAWINRAEDGKDWLQVDLQSHHNENQPQDSIKRSDQTTSDTEVVALDKQSVMVMYDRIHHGWSAMPRELSRYEQHLGC